MRGCIYKEGDKVDVEIRYGVHKVVPCEILYEESAGFIVRPLDKSIIIDHTRFKSNNEHWTREGDIKGFYKTPHVPVKLNEDLFEL